MHGNLDLRERHAVRLGVAGAVLAFLVLATVQAVAIRPYLPPDELYHVGYAAMILDGRLPTLTTPLPEDRVPLLPDDGWPRRVYVANHPPLFYAVTAVPLGLGERFGSQRAGFVAARMVSVSLAAAGLVMVAWLALSLVPGRPRVAVGAAWLAALLPSLPHVSAFVYNDGLGFLAAAATLAAAAAVVRRGPTLPRLAGVAVAAVARLRRHQPARRDPPAVVSWGLALAWLAGTYAMVASYDGHGGHLHPRYLFPGLAVLAVVGALGLDRLPGARLGLWLLGVALAQLALTAVAWAGFVTALRGRRPDGPGDLLDALAGLLETAGVARPWPLLALAAPLLLGALVLLGVALVRFEPPDPRQTPMAALETSHAA